MRTVRLGLPLGAPCTPQHLFSPLPALTVRAPPWVRCGPLARCGGLGAPPGVHWRPGGCGRSPGVPRGRCGGRPPPGVCGRGWDCRCPGVCRRGSARRWGPPWVCSRGRGRSRGREDVREVHERLWRESGGQGGPGTPPAPRVPYPPPPGRPGPSPFCSPRWPFAASGRRPGGSALPAGTVVSVGQDTQTTSLPRAPGGRMGWTMSGGTHEEGEARLLMGSGWGGGLL